MKFLSKIEVGEKIWVKKQNVYGAKHYYNDLVLRVLKTKIVTKTHEFSTKDGNSFSNNDKVTYTIVEYTDEIEQFRLQEKFHKLLKNVENLKFDTNEKFNNFIIKLDNLYNANKGIKNGKR